MTCFWAGILKGLSNDFKISNAIQNETNLVQFFKKKNSFDVFFRPVMDKIQAHPVVLWQNVPLSPQQILEINEWVNVYDETKIHNGHMTSSCDPFLCLLCAVCECSIEHNYNNSIIRYTNTFDHSSTWIYFKSNTGHFWFDKKIQKKTTTEQ